MSAFKSPFTLEKSIWKLENGFVVQLFADGVRSTSRRPQSRPAASDFRETFLNQIQFRVQRWWVHPKVQRREQTHWPFVDLPMSLKLPPNALLQLTAYHNENIRSVMLICRFHQPEGREATSLGSLRMFIDFWELAAGAAIRCGSRARRAEVAK